MLKRVMPRQGLAPSRSGVITQTDTSKISHLTQSHFTQADTLGDNATAPLPEGPHRDFRFWVRPLQRIILPAHNNVCGLYSKHYYHYYC